MTARGVDAALQESGIKPGEGAAAMLSEEAQQDELFADDMRAQAEALEEKAPAVWDGKGRKPGARNRTTRRVVDFIQATARDPLIFWSHVISMSAEDVKTRWQFGTLAGALQFQNECAKNLAPYLHSKKPLALAIAARFYEPVEVHFGSPDGGADPDIVGGVVLDEAIDAPFVDITQKQLLSRNGVDVVAQPDSRTGAPSD